MANFDITFKTNDFYVTDEKRYERIMDGLSCEYLEREFYRQPSVELSYLTKFNAEFYDKKGNRIPLSELDSHSEIYRKNINGDLHLYYQWKDESGRRKHGFGAYDCINYYPLPSQCSEIETYIKDGIKLFDENNNLIAAENIDDYDKIYDSEGDLIFDRMDVDNIDDTDSFYEALKEVIAPDSAIAIQMIGSEKLNQMFSEAVIITNDTIEFHSLNDIINKSIERMKNNN